MIGLELFFLFIITTIMYFGYQYVQQIISAQDDPNYVIILRLLMVGIIANLVIYLILILYNYYKSQIGLIGRPGKKGSKGDQGLIGDPICPKSRSENCNDYYSPEERTKMDEKLPPRESSFKRILKKKILISNKNGCALTFGELQSENNKIAKFSCGRTGSTFIIEEDRNGNHHIKLIPLDTKVNDNLIYGLNMMKRSPNQVDTKTYFPPSEKFAIFTEDGTTMPVTLVGNSRNFKIQTHHNGNLYGLIFDARPGIGPGIEQGELIAKFKRDSEGDNLFSEILPNQENNPLKRILTNIRATDGNNSQ